MLSLTIHADARWRPQFASAPPEVQAWYQNAELTPEAEARFHFHKCCAKSETVKTRFNVNKTTAGDEWYWLDGEKWRRIPNDIIHWNEPTPDGQPVLFVLLDGRETCFYPGTGGI